MGLFRLFHTLQMQSRIGLSQSLLFQLMAKKAKPMFVLLSWEALLVITTYAIPFLLLNIRFLLKILTFLDR